MKFYWLVLGVLCVWRVTHLLHAEDGPWDLLVRLRRGVGNGFWGGLLDCFYCLSLWIALPLGAAAGAGLEGAAAVVAGVVGGCDSAATLDGPAGSTAAGFLHRR